jgi:post-segregation antitoxin (ccd killing protein)
LRVGIPRKARRWFDHPVEPAPGFFVGSRRRNATRLPRNRLRHSFLSTRFSTRDSNMSEQPLTARQIALDDARERAAEIAQSKRPPGIDRAAVAQAIRMAGLSSADMIDAVAAAAAAPSDAVDVATGASPDAWTDLATVAGAASPVAATPSAVRQLPGMLPSVIGGTSPPFVPSTLRASPMPPNLGCWNNSAAPPSPMQVPGIPPVFLPTPGTFSLPGSTPGMSSFPGSSPGMVPVSVTVTAVQPMVQRAMRLALSALSTAISNAAKAEVNRAFVEHNARCRAAMNGFF